MNELPRFNFVKPVLGRDSYSPDSWLEWAVGIEFDIEYDKYEPYGRYVERSGTVKVFVPWSNISCVVREEHWK